MNNKMIGKCKNCELSYCLECSEHGQRIRFTRVDWKEFCSDDCYDEWRKENSLKKEEEE